MVKSVGSIVISGNLTYLEFSRLSPAAQRELLFCDGKIIKFIIRQTLQNLNAWNDCICASSEKERRKKASLHIGGMFRHRSSAQMSGQRNMTVGRRELMLEFGEGIKPPTFLNLRVVRGDLIAECRMKVLSEIFLNIKTQGIFEQSYLCAIEKMIEDFVSVFRENHR